MPDNEKDPMFIALSAITDTLTKQQTVLNALLSKAEEDEQKKKDEEEAKEAEEATEKIVKSIVERVMKSIEPALTKAGTENAKGQGITDKQIDPTLKAGEAQKIIQAAVVKAEEKKEDKKEEKKEEEKKEFPEFEALKKELADLKKSMADKVNSEVDSRLRKAGWMEEKGNVGVRKVEIGDQTSGSEIRKAIPTDSSASLFPGSKDELVKQSYGTLKSIELKAEANELPEGMKQLLQ